MKKALVFLVIATASLLATQAMAQPAGAKESTVNRGGPPPHNPMEAKDGTSSDTKARGVKKRGVGKSKVKKEDCGTRHHHGLGLKGNSGVWQSLQLNAPWKSVLRRAHIESVTQPVAKEV